jgi:hypothetical protein
MTADETTQGQAWLGTVHETTFATLGDIPASLRYVQAIAISSWGHPAPGPGAMNAG